MPGGPSLYSARAAAALGADVTLITCELVSAGPAAFDRSVLSGIEVVELPRTKGRPMPRYANAYDAGGRRSQLLLEPGDVLPAVLPVAGTGQADVLIYAPAFHELPSPPERPLRARHTAVSLQGLLRDVDHECRVVPHRSPLAQVERWAERADFAFLSEEDTGSAKTLARQLARNGTPTFLTRGYLGARLFDRTSERDFPAFSVVATDPTGAGDCFATAFMIRYAECAEIEESAQFASAAGALAVQAPGLAGVPRRHEIEALLARVAA